VKEKELAFKAGAAVRLNRMIPKANAGLPLATILFLYM
jgi:hypothetical protein